MFSFNKYNMRTTKPKDFIHDEKFLKAMRMALRDFGFTVDPQIKTDDLMHLYLQGLALYDDALRVRVTNYRERMK